MRVWNKEEANHWRVRATEEQVSDTDVDIVVLQQRGGGGARVLSIFCVIDRYKRATRRGKVTHQITDEFPGKAEGTLMMNRHSRSG